MHEGPRQVALLSDDEPLTAPLVPNLSVESPFLPSGQVTYSKGASVLHMLQAFLDAQQPGTFQVLAAFEIPRLQEEQSIAARPLLTMDAFHVLQAGLRRYLQGFAYSTATVDDVVSSTVSHYNGTNKVCTDITVFRQDSVCKAVLLILILISSPACRKCWLSNLSNGFTARASLR